MPVIMILYYAICAYIAGMLIWNFIREKKSVNDMLLYLLVRKLIQKWRKTCLVYG